MSFFLYFSYLKCVSCHSLSWYTSLFETSCLCHVYACFDQVLVEFDVGRISEEFAVNITTHTFLTKTFKKFSCRMFSKFIFRKDLSSDKLNCSDSRPPHQKEFASSWQKIAFTGSVSKGRNFNGMALLLSDCMRRQ